MLTAATPLGTPKSAEMHPGVGFQIRSTFRRPAPDLVARIRQFDTPDISDMLNRLSTMSADIHNVCRDAKIAGPACTVKVFPGDNLMVHKALDIAQPGDVIVVDAGGSRTNGLVGDLICTKAKHRGVAAFVIDGLVRDLPELQTVGLPVFARGVTPIGPLHRGPGEINYPVSCGGIVVNPGDLIVGDPNGLVVIRQDDIETILARLVVQQASLETYVANVKRGVFSNEWVTAVLNEAGCTVEE